MSQRHWLLFILLAGCAWTIGYYMGGDATPGGPPVSDVAGSGSTLADFSSARRRAAVTSEGEASSEPIPHDLLLSQMRTLLENPDSRWRREQFVKLLRSVPAAEIPEFLSQLKNLSPSDRTMVSSLLLMLWAAERPREAMEYAYRTKNGVPEVMTEWSASDPLSAMAWVKALPQGPDRDSAVAWLIPNLAWRDPQAAFQMIQGWSEMADLHTRTVMTRWAQKDLKAAIAVAESLPTGTMATVAAFTVAESWAKADPAKALEWGLRFGDPELRRRAAESALAEWAKSDPDAALKRVADFPSELERASALATLVSAMAEKDPDRAAAMMEKLPIGIDRQRATSSLVAALAEKDPHRAALYVEQISPEYSNEPVRTVLEHLLPKDPKAALELALKLDRKLGHQHLVLGTVFADWMRREPAGALDWLAKNEVPKVSGPDIASAVSQWAKQNAEEARTLAETSSVPAVMNGALQGILDKDPTTAARLALTKGADEVYGSVWQQIGSSWASRDVAEAAEWLKQLPANRAQERATSGVIVSWAQRDAAAAATWIDGLKPGNLRDHATYAFASNISRQDPAGALTWAGSIQKEETKSKLMAEVLRRWSERDLSSAKEWANAQSNLPADVQANVPLLQPKR